jgi:hypothetical protein
MCPGTVTFATDFTLARRVAINNSRIRFIHLHLMFKNFL